MKIFIFEYLTGGGLYEQGQPLPGLRKLLAEGRAMATALAEDFARLPECEVTVSWDAALEQHGLPACRVELVHSWKEMEHTLHGCAKAADGVVIIAPENDGILFHLVAAVTRVGGRLWGPNEEFVRLASNKHATAEALSAAGVRTPPGMHVHEGANFPNTLSLPAVWKPLDGADSQGIRLITTRDAGQFVSPGVGRVEAFIPGRAASVACLCGSGKILPLTPCWQFLGNDGTFEYQGGGLPLPSALAARATALARRAIEALPPATGYVGVDLVLADASDGSQDTVIEVNPRLTTSYIGLRQAYRQNLAEAWWHVLQGEPIPLDVSPEPLRFFRDGTVRRDASLSNSDEGAA